MLLKALETLSLINYMRNREHSVWAFLNSTAVIIHV